MILSPGWWRIYFSRYIISETQSWEQMDKKQGRFFNFQNLFVLAPIRIFRLFSVQYIDLQYSHWHEIIQIQLDKVLAIIAKTFWKQNKKR